MRAKKATKAKTKTIETLVPVKIFAPICGVHHKTVSLWIRDGLPVAKRVGTAALIDLLMGVPWVRARDAQVLADTKARVSPDAARAAKTVAEAQLKELDLAERIGEMVSASEVEERWSQILISVREGVMALPGIAVQTGLIRADQETAFEAMCRDALVAISKPQEMNSD